MTKRRILMLVAALAAVAALVFGRRAWVYARSHESTDDAQVDGHIIPVLARVSGYVQSVGVDENHAVRAGELLVQIDETEYRQRMAAFTADLAAAEAVPGQANAEVAVSLDRRAALDPQIQAARATLERARADLARGEELARREIISRQQLDALRNALAVAEAGATALDRQAAAASGSVAAARAGLRLAEARIDVSKAEREHARLELAWTHVTAPGSGVVSRRNVVPGQYVQAGQPLMTIVADSDTWVTANFKETQLAGMRVGQPVELEVDAYDGCHAEGKVESISPATGARFALLPPDNATGNFTKVVQRVPVRIAITRGCGAERPLRPGLSLKAIVRTG